MSTIYNLCQLQGRKTRCSWTVIANHNSEFTYYSKLGQIFQDSFTTLCCFWESVHQSLKSINWLTFWNHEKAMKLNVFQLFYVPSLFCFCNHKINVKKKIQHDFKVYLVQLNMWNETMCQFHCCLPAFHWQQSCSHDHNHDHPPCQTPRPCSGHSQVSHSTLYRFL